MQEFEEWVTERIEQLDQENAVQQATISHRICRAVRRFVSLMHTCGSKCHTVLVGLLCSAQSPTLGQHARPLADCTA